MGLGGLGMMEILLIFLVVLLLFGAKRLPEIGSSLGKGIREFKSSVREIEGELKAPLEEAGRQVESSSSPSATETVKETVKETVSEEDGEPRKLTSS